MGSNLNATAPKSLGRKLERRRSICASTVCLNEELPEGGNLNDYFHEFSSLLEFPALQLPYSKFKKVGITKYFTFLYPFIYNPALLDYNIIKPAGLLYRLDKPTFPLYTL